jgi:hypothetical protein
LGCSPAIRSLFSFLTSMRLSITMLARTLSLWHMAILLPAVQGLQIESSPEFPLGSEVENLALRPSGSVIATVYTFPYIFEVTSGPDSRLRALHIFQNTTGACGIAESSTPDVFFVLTGNFSFQTAPRPDHTLSTVCRLTIAVMLSSRKSPRWKQLRSQME